MTHRYELTQAGSAPAPVPAVVVTISPVADQITLAAVGLVGEVLVGGAVAEPDEWEWRANGSAVGFSDATVGAPVYTAKYTGSQVLTLRVRLGDSWYAAPPVATTVAPLDTAGSADLCCTPTLGLGAATGEVV